MGRQILDALVGLLSFVGAVEIRERKRNVVGQALQQFDQLGRERTPFVRHEQQHAGETPFWLKSGSAAPALAPLIRALS